MQTIKNISLALCGVLVATSFASLLLPDSKFKKLLGYIISLVMILSVAGVIKNFDINFDVDAAVTADNQNLENMTAGQAGYILEAYLKENGITVQKVLCNMDILDNGDIVINKACVYTCEEGEKVKKLLLEGFGIQEVEIYDE